MQACSVFLSAVLCDHKCHRSWMLGLVDSTTRNRAQNRQMSLHTGTFESYWKSNRLRRQWLHSLSVKLEKSVQRISINTEQTRKRFAESFIMCKIIRIYCLNMARCWVATGRNGNTNSKCKRGLDWSIPSMAHCESMKPNKKQGKARNSIDYTAILNDYASDYICLQSCWQRNVFCKINKNALMQ